MYQRYDRAPAPYNGRPTQPTAPPRGENAYERDAPRHNFLPLDPALKDQERYPTRRPEHGSPIQDHFPTRREPHFESWIHEPWRVSSSGLAYGHRPSPPLPLPPTNFPTAHGERWPPQPPLGHMWEDRRPRERDDRQFEPSAAWRQTHGGAQAQRLPPPVELPPVGPVPDGRRWPTSALEPAPRNSSHLYPEESFPFDFRPPPSYEVRHYPDRQIHNQPPLYRPPPQRIPFRSSSDYSRPRQASGPAYSRLEDVPNQYARERSMSARLSRDGSMSSPLPSTAYEHMPPQQFIQPPHQYPIPRALTQARRSRDASPDSRRNFSGEESDGGHSFSSSRSTRSRVTRSVPPPVPPKDYVPRAVAQSYTHPGANQSRLELPSNRQDKSGVMSVHQLLSPVPAKVGVPQTNPAQSDQDTSNGESSSPRKHSDILMLHETSAAPGTGDAQDPLESSSKEKEISVKTDLEESTPRDAIILDHTESRFVVAIPATRSPDPPDVDKTLAEVDDLVAPLSRSSLNATPVIETKVIKIVETEVVEEVPPLSSEELEALRKETLRKAIVARRQYSTQSREQRVNPILLANLTKNETPTRKRKRTSPEELIDEVFARIFSRSNLEPVLRIRANLATGFAAQRELQAEKIQRLRNQYRSLNRKWQAHCARLDAALKANVMEETMITTGRTTRRSAATLGDAVRSDLEMEQIIASLGNEDLTDPNHLAVRNVATIPDMISVENGFVDYIFDDTNNLVDDPASFYDARSGFYDWNAEEEKIFYDKFAENPKQFGIIASFLPHKTPSQCVLYYYLHKKKLIDFRAAVNNVSGKRKRGTRKAGKQKSNALLTDVQQADSQRPAGGRRRRGAAATTGDGRGPGRGRAAANEEGESRAKRRRVGTATEQLVANDGNNDSSVDTESQREQSTIPPKKRRGRKAKVIAESPAPSPLPETKFIDVNETLGRRKPGVQASHWTVADREEFLRLLARHGKNFKRIAASMPNKTTIQVSNYYKSHATDLDLDKIAASAQSRSQSPDPAARETPTNGAEGSIMEQSEHTMPNGEMQVQLGAEPLPFTVEGVTPDGGAGSSVSVLTLNQNNGHIWMPEEYPFAQSSHHQAQYAPQASNRAPNQKTYISVLHPASFQVTSGNPRGAIISARGQSSIDPPNGSRHAPSPDRLSPELSGEIPQRSDSPVYDEHQPPELIGNGDSSGHSSNSRYSSFRAQVGRVNSRTPIAIQPAPAPPTRAQDNAYPYTSLQPNAWPQAPGEVKHAGYAHPGPPGHSLPGPGPEVHRYQLPVRRFQGTSHMSVPQRFGQAHDYLDDADHAPTH